MCILQARDINARRVVAKRMNSLPYEQKIWVQIVTRKEPRLQPIRDFMIVKSLEHHHCIFIYKWPIDFDFKLMTNNSVQQGRRKMKKVRGILRAMKTQVLLGGPQTRPPEIFFYF